MIGVFVDIYHSIIHCKVLMKMTFYQLFVISVIRSYKEIIIVIKYFN